MKRAIQSNIFRLFPAFLLVASLFPVAAFGQTKRLVVIDQDTAGPGGTDMLSILILLQSPNVETLGITVVTGDAWRDEEVAHAQRLLELIGRTDIPVVPGAAFPLKRTEKGTGQWEKQYGKVQYKGAWDPGQRHDPFVVPPLIEGNPAQKSAQNRSKNAQKTSKNDDSAHFLVEIVRKYPHKVTIYEGGPMTDLALALRLDPQFAELSNGLVFMGGSLNPETTDPEFTAHPHREFNLWFDPEAAHEVLCARWPSIVATTVDVSVKTQLTQAMLDEIAKVRTPVARYLARYSPKPGSGSAGYFWDELAAAAWLDPSLITAERQVYLDVDVDHGAHYGETLSWPDRAHAPPGAQLVHAQMDVNMPKFAQFLVRLVTGPTPNARNPLMNLSNP